jgi:hypothetical protein
MQLSLTREELELLKWILQEDNRLSRSEALSLQIAVGIVCATNCRSAAISYAELSPGTCN